MPLIFYLLQFLSCWRQQISLAGDLKVLKSEWQQRHSQGMSGRLYFILSGDPLFALWYHSQHRCRYIYICLSLSFNFPKVKKAKRRGALDRNLSPVQFGAAFSRLAFDPPCTWCPRIICYTLFGKLEIAQLSSWRNKIASNLKTKWVDDQCAH